MNSLIMLGVIGTFISTQISGCLVKEETQDAKRVIVDSVEELPSFEQCLAREFTIDQNITARDRSSYFVARSHRFIKRSKMIVTVGYYEEVARESMRGQVPSGGLYDDEDSGDYDSAINFINRNNITCKRERNNLVLIFPTHRDDRSQDYKEVEVGVSSRSTREKVLMDIGLNKKNGNGLAVTITHMKEDGNNRIMQFTALDTNSSGEIIKHSKVVGAGGREQVIMER